LDDLNAQIPQTITHPPRPGPLEDAQWFSIIQRKRLRIVNFALLAHLEDRRLALITHGNARAHPFHWSSTSVANVMAACSCDQQLAA